MGCWQLIFIKDVLKMIILELRISIELPEKLEIHEDQGKACQKLRIVDHTHI